MSRMLTGGFCAETQGNQSNFDGGKAQLQPTATEYIPAVHISVPLKIDTLFAGKRV